MEILREVKFHGAMKLTIILTYGRSENSSQSTTLLLKKKRKNFKKMPKISAAIGYVERSVEKTDILKCPKKTNIKDKIRQKRV